MDVAPPTTAGPDPAYADGRSWLCRPDLPQDACDVDLDATAIGPDGALSVDRHRPADAPQIDCFYVYPTVSNDPTWQSDLQPDEAEYSAVARRRRANRRPPASGAILTFATPGTGTWPMRTAAAAWSSSATARAERC